MNKTSASTVPSVPWCRWGSGSRLLPRAPGSPVWARLCEDFFRIKFACAPSLDWAALRAQLGTAWHSFLPCGHKLATLYGLKQHRSLLLLIPEVRAQQGSPWRKAKVSAGLWEAICPLALSPLPEGVGSLACGPRPHLQSQLLSGGSRAAPR